LWRSVGSGLQALSGLLMLNMRVPMCLIAVIACTQAACSERRISLAYTPPGNVAAVPGASQVTLDVVGLDKRMQVKDRIGEFRGSPLRVVAEKDVPVLVRGAVAGALTDQGFFLASSGLVVTVELLNFYCAYEYRAKATVAFALHVDDAAGRTLYTGAYDGASVAGGPYSLHPIDQVTTALDQATGEAIKQLIEDKALQRALLSARSRAQP
jgi:uncharacterized lipoprotein YajG